jgi:hypothetical protein
MGGALKLGIAVTLAAAGAGLLFVLAAGARERGRTSYCRNNLRKLGEWAAGRLDSGNPIDVTGRRFWQEIRFLNFTTVRGEEVTWVVRFGGLNPFGCPVRGVQPLDLSELSKENLERHLKDPATIDYRGPRRPSEIASAKGPMVVGADLAGNHSGGRGHVLLMDLSVKEIRDSVQFKDLRDMPGADAELAD